MAYRMETLTNLNCIHYSASNTSSIIFFIVTMAYCADTTSCSFICRLILRENFLVGLLIFIEFQCLAECYLYFLSFQSIFMMSFMHLAECFHSCSRIRRISLKYSEVELLMDDGGRKKLYSILDGTDLGHVDSYVQFSDLNCRNYF